MRFPEGNPSTWLIWPPNAQALAAPLASVWSVEDGGTRQLTGNARAADPWSARSIGVL